MTAFESPRPRVSSAADTGAWLIGATLIVFAVIVAVVSLRLRAEVREQVIGRDAEVLMPVVTQQLERAQAAFPDAGPALREANILAVILEASELRNVVAVRYFDVDGGLVEAFPTAFILGEIAPGEWEALRAGRSISRYHPDAELDRFFHTPDAARVQARHPLLAVVIPVLAMDSPRLLGAAEFLVDGAGLQAEFRALDRNLLYQAGIAFASGALIVGGVGFWGFRRLDRSQRLLADRSRRLQEANRRLTLRARTAAIGVVAAHLMHDLKNTVSGLREYVAAPASTGEETRLASQLTRRMQDRIQEVLAFVREEENEEVFEFGLDEVLELVRKRLSDPAGNGGVRLRFDAAPERRLDNRTGNLLTLTLENLIQNAIEATPAGEAVSVECAVDGELLTITVRDAGPGLDSRRSIDPFRPYPSEKPGGAGIGLMLSHELAAQMGATLELLETGAAGTVFRLTLRDPDRDPSAS